MNKIAYGFKKTAELLFGLALAEPTDEEAIYRRVVSGAYYAVFRLIVDDGVVFLFGQEPSHHNTRKLFSRHFEHKTIRSVFLELSKQSYSKNWHSYEPLFQPHKPLLMKLCASFTELQLLRMVADYEINHYIAKDEAEKSLDYMDSFFIDWDILKQATASTPQTIHTLVSLLFIGEIRQ